METCGRPEGLIDYIAERYCGAVEIGIGHSPVVAAGLLSRGIRIFATDIRPFAYKGFHCIIDDITEPDISFYHDIDLVYSIKPPPELVPYMKNVAQRISADLIVKPLSSEYCDGQLIRHGNVTFYLWKFHG